MKENGGIFMKFGWRPDEYNPGKEEEKREKDAHLAKIMDLHKKQFNPAKIKKNLPYDYPFAGSEPSVHNFLTASDPYSAPVSERLRN